MITMPVEPAVADEPEYDRQCIEIPFHNCEPIRTKPISEKPPLFDNFNYLISSIQKNPPSITLGQRFKQYNQLALQSGILVDQEIDQDEDQQMELENQKGEELLEHDEGA